MRKVILLSGLPGSGKSTWAIAEIEANPGVYKRINRDSLRTMFDNYKLTNANEKFLKKVRDTLILMVLDEGKSVIVDDTNLSPKNETHIRQLVKGKAEVEVKIFDISLEECLIRDLKRPNSVGHKVINKMYNQFLAPKIDPYLAPEESLPAVICDLDGTLCLHNGRNPYDWSKCDTDKLNEAVSHVLGRLTSEKIILLSGRSDDAKDLTTDWLEKHKIRYDELHMRKTGDRRKDSIIKQELFDAHVRGKYRVLFVLDDRDIVVSLWRNMGLSCFQVNYGDF